MKTQFLIRSNGVKPFRIIVLIFSQNEARQHKMMFEKIQTFVADMVNAFKESKFYLCVAQRQNYTDGINFTENNIVQYLAELEEYISSLIAYTAFKNEKPDAAISYIPLEKLLPKDYNKKNTAYTFDKPDETQLQNVDEDAYSREGELTNARELFKRYNQHLEDGNILPVF